MKLISALVLFAAVQLSSHAAPSINLPPSCPLAPICQPGGVLVCDRLCNCSCQYPVE